MTSLPPCPSSLSPAALAAHLRADLKQQRTAALDGFKRHASPTRLLHELARIVDHIISQIWSVYALEQPASIVAVGGYGRGELFPHSDVDILILTTHVPSNPDQALIATMISLLWDIGLEPGHSVRTIDECLVAAASDISIQTALLEARYVCGAPCLCEALVARLRAELEIKKFFRAKYLEMQQRHGKYQDTPYSLEPNCKESPGGLRDLQMILWITSAAGLGTTWAEMSRHGLLTSAEVKQLRRNETILKTIRIHLHCIAQRREDRLIFDLQTPLAHALSFQASATRRASELLMQRYYWAAKMVAQLNVILVQNIETLIFPAIQQAPVAIDEHFQNVNQLLDMVDAQVFENSPSALLEVFLVMQQHSELKGISARTLRALWHARNRINRGFRRDAKNRALFLNILQQPRGVAAELRRMNQLSVLGHYLPPFRKVIGQMQHDLFHAYTVDQHTLMVIGNLYRFTIPEFSHEYPLCSQLIANFARPWLLYIAALFHDIAKGRGGDHSQLGKLDARRFCRDHQLSIEDTELVVFLVEHHLTLSRVAQKEDLSDASIIGRFAKLMRSERRLNALYLLTVADIRGTSPNVWNAWKAKLIAELYHATLRILGGTTITPHAQLAEKKKHAQQLLMQQNLDDELRACFWQQFDIAYFLRHDAQEIAWATQAFAHLRDSKQPHVRARAALLGEGLQIAVYSIDQPELLARICEFFEHQGFSIVDAHVHTSKNGYALDTFHVIEQGSLMPAHQMLDLIEEKLADHIQRAAPLTPYTPGRLSRHSKHFPLIPSVDLHADERGKYYLLNFSATDRSGLLYAVLCVLTKHRINVQMAKITTLGERAEDFFLIDGRNLSDAKTQLLLENELLEVLTI